MRVLAALVLVLLIACARSEPLSSQEDAGSTIAAMDAAVARPSLAPGDHPFMLQVSGRMRRYVVHVPSMVEATPPAVLLVLHGGGGNADETAISMNMTATSDQLGFVAVYPEGVAMQMGASRIATWNAGVCCGPAMEQNVDDVAYFRALLDDLATHHDFDKRRVYATGLSNGSMMTIRLGCELSDRIAAIAPVAGQATGFDCTPARPVPVILIHGTDDRCATFNGGAACGGCFQRFINNWLGTSLEVDHWPCSSASEEVARWRTINACAPGSTISYENGAARCETWTCDAGSEVTYCPIEGGGHTWPSGNHPQFCERPESAACVSWIAEVGTISTDIGNSQIWEFLRRFSL